MSTQDDRPGQGIGRFENVPSFDELAAAPGGLIPPRSTRGGKRRAEAASSAPAAPVTPAASEAPRAADPPAERQLRAVRAASSASTITSIEGSPAHTVNVSNRTEWRYSLGTPEWARGGYEQLRVDRDTSEWVDRFPLPYVHARLARRNGAGDITATDLLISLHPDSRRVVVPFEELTTGGWAGRLGAPLSGDTTIRIAAGTAITQLAHRPDVPEVECVPRADRQTTDGRLFVPPPECLPAAYLVRPRFDQVPEVDQVAAALEVLEAACGLPKLALGMGASAASPYVGPLDRQAFVMQYYGDPGQGKTTILRCCAMLWGLPRTAIGVIATWNATARGPGRFLGQLGLLPPFFDETGVGQRTPDDWAQLIFEVCEGNSRMMSERFGNRSTSTPPWFGVLFATGNGRILDGVGAGETSGTLRRVIELGTPFTDSAEQSDRLRKVCALRGYGWVGPRILDTYTLEDVRLLLERAETLVRLPEGETARSIGEHLALCVAGAIMLDRLFDLGGRLVKSALDGARQYLSDHADSPEHDADRALAGIGDRIDQQPSAWPTVEQAALHAEVAGSDMYGNAHTQARLPGHGLADKRQGLRDDEWVYVLRSAWDQLVKDLKIDEGIALAELHRRGVLHAPTAGLKGSSHGRKRWEVNGPKYRGKRVVTRAYKIRRDAVFPPDEDGQSEPSTLPPGDDQAPSVDDQAPSVDDQAPPVDEGPLVDPTESLPGLDEELVAALAAGEPSRREPEPASDQPASDQPASSADRPADTVERTSRNALRNMPLTEARTTMIRENRAAVAAGEQFRALDMLAESFVPRLGKRRAATYRKLGEVPPPEVTGKVHSVRGYEWSRPYDGPVTVLDRNASYPSSAASVLVSHAALERTGALDGYDRTRAGYYEVPVFPWVEAGMPSPLGGQHWHRPDRETLWLTGPTVELLLELVAQDRWPAFEVVDSWTAPGARMTQWTDMLKSFRADALRAGDDAAYQLVKGGISAAFGLMRGVNNGIERNLKSSMYVPDWFHTIEAGSAATMWRRADACRKVAGEELAPVKLANVDELHIPTAALEIVTGGPRPAISIDELGIGYGTFKVKK